MPDDEPIPNRVIKSLTSSGFPFQTAVIHEVEKSKNWFVHATEYPWRGRHDDQFLDLVATNKRFFLTVECKKTRKDILTFLLPLGFRTRGDVVDIRCLRGDHDFIKRSVTLFCETRAFSPPSTCSEFCVVSTSKDGRDLRLLERDASLVIGATDAFARDVGRRLPLGNELLNPSFFVPVIVTNARIYTAVYKPANVSLQSGEFQDIPGIEEAQWVRFSKAFNVVEGRDLGARSVFVVNSASFAEFLELLELRPNQPDNHAIKVTTIRQL